MDVVRLAWPGWQVEWAARGATQVAAAAGFDPAPLVAPDLGSSRKPGKDTPQRALQAISRDLDAVYADGADELSYYNTVVSVATVADAPRHYGLACIGYWTDYVALAGPELLDVLEGSPLHHLSALPPETLDHDVADAEQGIAVDFQQKDVWLWSLNRFASPAWVDLIEQSWEGWRIRQHVEGMPRHAELVGVNPASVRLPWEQFLHWFERRATAYLTKPDPYTGITAGQVGALLQEAQAELPAKPDLSGLEGEARWRASDAWRRRWIASIMAKVRREGLPSYPDSPYRPGE